VAKGPRGRWGSIYSPHLKRAVGGIFHQTSPVRPLDKSGGPLWKSVFRPDKSSGALWKSVGLPVEASLRPDKSGGALWSPVQTLWKPVDSSDKSGETWKLDFWMVKHLGISPNFFDVSLLIVRLSYDSNKI
jgi:hypothetical protein